MAKVAVDKNALVFSQPNSFKYTPNENDSQSGFQFEMIGYSGDILNHWWWDNLAFDLEGMVVPKQTIPILWSHDTERPMGFSTPPSVTDKLVFTSDQVTLLSGNEDVDKFVSNSKQGMPYQASIRCNPTKIEYVPEDSFTLVNGKELHGPGHVFREWELVECSPCMFGADSNTESRAFSEGATIELDDRVFVNGQGPKDLSNFKTPDKREENVIMDMFEFKNKFPDEAAKFTACIKEEHAKEMETKFSAEREVLTTDLEKAKLMADEFKTKFEAADKEILAFKESALKLDADKIFNTCFSESELPERLHDKLRKFTNSEKFIADGKLDVDAFTNHVNEELEPWKTEFAEKPAEIQGGSAVKDAATGEELQFDADAIAAHMHSLTHTTSNK
jgi:hypothetical protein